MTHTEREGTSLAVQRGLGLPQCSDAVMIPSESPGSRPRRCVQRRFLRACATHPSQSAPSGPCAHTDGSGKRTLGAPERDLTEKTRERLIAGLHGALDWGSRREGLNRPPGAARGRRPPFPVGVARRSRRGSCPAHSSAAAAAHAPRPPRPSRVPRAGSHRPSSTTASGVACRFSHQAGSATPSRSWPSRPGWARPRSSRRSRSATRRCVGPSW